MGDRTFPESYYEVCSSLGREKRTNNWFCNRSLSPLNVTEDNTSAIQDITVSTSDQSTGPENNSQEAIPSPDSSVISNSEDDPEFFPSSSSEDSSELEEQEQKESSPVITRVDDIIYDNSQSEVTTQNNSPEVTVLTSKQSISEESNIFYGKRRRQKDFCYFCESLVQNFARHVVRNHSSEVDVQRILSFPTNSSKRREMITLLRKKGNFLNAPRLQKAVKKSTLKPSLLPCEDCLGFYSAKQLWRHRKKCAKNASTKKTQSEAQNFLIKNLQIDSELKTKVFPRMRPDSVSLVAKKDALICAFGTRYLKVHRDSHSINVVSRKMREIARFLIEMRTIDSSKKTLFEYLKPENYDEIVQATKSVAAYDYEKQLFKSPTYAMNMGTTLKQCCDISIMFALKKKEVYQNVSVAEIEGELKTIHLISTNWKFDVSNEAGNNLQMNRWNKITLIPLASDIKLLKSYLIEKGNEAAFSLLNGSEDETLYKTLMETIYCRVILLNRKRPGELQRLLLHTYEQSLADGENANYEEFSETVTPTEKILMKKFKRLVIRGKRSRGVPVLFTDDVQEHIEILLKYRQKFAKKPNLYLFGNIHSSEPIWGYKVLKKYAMASGTKNPKAITCTKLRKHLATLSQIFNMSENDLEQLASFMGHTFHRQSYRLPNDVFQTAKISKILLLMESGSLANYKGKTLDEIDVNLEEDLMNEKNESGDEANVIEEEKELDQEILQAAIQKSGFPRRDGAKEKILRTGSSKSEKNRRVLVRWTDEQKNLVSSFFAGHIRSKIPPKKHECEKLLGQHPQIFHNKNWLKIKVFVQNKYTGKC